MAQEGLTTVNTGGATFGSPTSGTVQRFEAGSQLSTSSDANFVNTTVNNALAGNQSSKVLTSNAFKALSAADQNKITNAFAARAASLAAPIPAPKPAAVTPVAVPKPKPAAVTPVAVPKPKPAVVPLAPASVNNPISATAPGTLSRVATNTSVGKGVANAPGYLKAPVSAPAPWPSARVDNRIVMQQVGISGSDPLNKAGPSFGGFKSVKKPWQGPVEAAPARAKAVSGSKARTSSKSSKGRSSKGRSSSRGKKR